MKCECQHCGHEFDAERIGGGHRLLCGDAGKAADHRLVIGDEKIDVVITDPPYGVGIDYAEFDDTENETRALIDKFMPLVLKHPIVALTSGIRCMWFYPRPTWLLAWIHPAGMGSGPWGFTMLNPILVYGKDPYLTHRLGGRGDALVLATDREEKLSHPVVKPIQVWKWLIERTTVKSKKHLLDPFSGAGTTIIAAELTGNFAHAIEISPAYVDVAVSRWEKFTGRKAVSAAGRFFS